MNVFPRFGGGGGEDASRAQPPAKKIPPLGRLGPPHCEPCSECCLRANPRMYVGDWLCSFGSGGKPWSENQEAHCTPLHLTSGKLEQRAQVAKVGAEGFTFTISGKIVRASRALIPGISGVMRVQYREIHLRLNVCFRLRACPLCLVHQIAPELCVMMQTLGTTSHMLLGTSQDTAIQVCAA